MEQTLGTQKQEVLSNLYALRAGLSVISIENDKAQNINGSVQNIYNQNTKEACQLTHQKLKNKEALTFGEWLGTEESKKYYETKIKEIEQRNAGIQSENSEKRNKVKTQRKKLRKKRIIFFSVLGLIFILAAIAILIGAKYDILALIIVGGAIFTMGGAPAIWLCIIIFEKTSKNNIPKANEERLIDTKNHYLILNNMQVFAERLNKAEEWKKPIPRIKENCEELYLALQREFTPILDVRDWKYVDLVIFYLETRRADDIKEALQLVDREMQAERIVQTINQATQQICNTLAIGFTMLNNSMVKCFNELSAQIAAASAAQSAQLTTLTEAVNMGNALKAKANVSSEKLMQDVQEIRNFVCY